MNRRATIFSVAVLTAWVALLFFGTVSLELSTARHHSDGVGCLSVQCGPVEHVAHHSFVFPHSVSDGVARIPQSILIFVREQYNNVALAPPAPPPKHFS